MRYVLVLGIMLAAMLALTQTMALQSAAVTGAQAIPVTNSSAALLSLVPGTGAGNSGSVAYISGGNLLLDFRKGFDGGTTASGFLRNTLAYKDRFRFKNLFTVTNRSGSSQCVSVWISGTAPDITGLYVRPAGTPVSDVGRQIAGSGGSFIDCEPVGAGGSLEVDFWFEISSTGAAYQYFDVRVAAERR